MGERKVRSDKKRSINPTVSLELRDCIYRLAFITETPIKDVIADILIEGSQRKKPMDHLSKHFIRDVRIGNSLYMGDNQRVTINRQSATGKTVRISTRVTQGMYSDLEGIAYSMGSSVSKACALLLEATIRDVEFVNEFVKRYIEANVDEKRMKELKKVLKYINAGNPYDERMSWPTLLSYLVDEVKVGAEKLQDTVQDFVISRWDKGE
ncbi:hypothetical protein [Sporosarcina ureae]|uniref:hypothetical protein n=1 Tax=Sporosarcina ureae TaxID=1571 RepID=UPI000A17F77E|nr:hypothetical protein [Sporosarcina ureae]ARK21358.1 hypothetical protein SporoP32a_07320 [Sporosarcina ureae]